MPTVTLLAYTPDPQKTVASAAKLCYSASTIKDLRDGLTEEKVTSFVDMLSEIGHESPIEHASFTFGIEGVSRSFLAQITRHRIASYSVKSQRYVKEGAFEYVTPPEIAAESESLALYEESMRAAQAAYDKLAETLTKKHKATFMAEGKDEKTAERLASKKAIEDARFVLPNACETKMVVTMNARSLLNFFRHRCCNRAQWEIQDVANKMLALVSEVAPDMFKKAGPPCLNGACPEGKMSCGKIKEIRKFYEDMKNNG
ncbi:MAG: FAD-dependent thymidylate synthase [Acutalibacteraceae bacterium]|nr:FAD-dependent thymidylate synthase [Clostridia bacterium]MEE0808425.1 FAD-dependent thymidylate synthase [Acutalibacteraceae bacterium]